MAEAEIVESMCDDPVPIEEAHECPFAVEIRGDSRLCRCCDSCTTECARDI